MCNMNEMPFNGSITLIAERDENGVTMLVLGL